jgi:hypothetical protein
MLRLAFLLLFGCSFYADAIFAQNKPAVQFIFVNKKRIYKKADSIEVQLVFTKVIDSVQFTLASKSLIHKNWMIDNPNLFINNPFYKQLFLIRKDTSLIIKIPAIAISNVLYFEKRKFILSMEMTPALYNGATNWFVQEFVSNEFAVSMGK